MRDYDAIKAVLERGEEVLISSEVVYVILDGENPVKVWCNYRVMGQKELAEKAGISNPYLLQLETGKK